jgi:hypothetical protein
LSDWVLIMTPLLPLSQHGKVLFLSLIFMVTCYHMNCVWRLTKQLLKSTSLLPTLLNVKVPAIRGTIVAPIRATATLISLMVGGVAVVEDHLNNILFLVRPNALRVKSVTSQATRLQLAGSVLNKDTNLKALLECKLGLHPYCI